MRQTAASPGSLPTSKSPRVARSGQVSGVDDQIAGRTDGDANSFLPTHRAHGEPGPAYTAAVRGGRARDAAEMVMTGGQFFRANVGIAVLHLDGQVLALERYELPGAWQLPQGGLDTDEEPADAARRELREETGLAWSQIEVLGEHPRWLAYELDADMRKPDTGRGQVQKWFVVRLVDEEATIDIGRVDERKGHPEFRAYKWMSLIDVVSNAPAFRLPAYEPLVDYIDSLTRA